MAKTTKTPTAPAAKPLTLSLTVPRLDDTKNYAKFGLEKDGNSAFGNFYLPLDEAEGVTLLSVTFTSFRKGGK